MKQYWEYRRERIQGESYQVPEILKQIGESGWELVCIYEGYYVFKRPYEGVRTL